MDASRTSSETPSDASSSLSPPSLTSSLCMYVFNACPAYLAQFLRVRDMRPGRLVLLHHAVIRLS